MKILSVLLLVCSLSYATSIKGQKVDVSVKEGVVLDVIEEIEEQCDFRFAYSPKFVDMDKSVSIEVHQMEVTDVLDEVLEETDLTYFIDGDVVVLRPEAMVSTTQNQQVITVKGVVADSKGDPIPGVNVYDKTNPSNGVITNMDGTFSIDVENYDAILTFSFIGFTTQEVTVEGRTFVNVTLQEDYIGLDEVVAIGYGTLKKSDLTGSVASTKGSELAKVNSSSVSTAVSGRLPGLQVTQSSASAGSGSVMRIRGVGSVYSNVDPLVIIDGFEGDINQVSSNDVETITVLKDAASASIYGARAANGVILITTKQGNLNQEMKISANVRYGVQQATNVPEMLGSVDWAYKMNEATMARSGMEYWVGDEAPENQTTNTDWFDYLLRTGQVQDYNISASGGVKKVRYSVNLNYFDQESILIGDSYKRASVRANVEYVTDRFSMGVRTYNYRSWKDSKDANFVNAMRTPPTIPVYNADGLPGTPREGTGEDLLQDETPTMSYIGEENSYLTDGSTINLYAELGIVDGLKAKTVFNMLTSNSYNEEWEPEWFSYRPDDTEHEVPYKFNSPAQLTTSHSNQFRWEWQNLLTYTKDFGRHHIDLLAGLSAQKTEYASLSAYRNTFARNSLQTIDAGSEDSQLNSGNSSISSISSQFGRVNYAFDNKYLLQMNIRRDGSSVFAPNKKWGVFPSVSAGWRLSEESFLKDNPIISNLKIRAGIGSLGNANIPSYKWLSSISFAYTGYVLGEEQVLNDGAYVSGAYNENISWEKTTTTNIAADLGLFNNKLNFTVELFNRKTTDMLLIMPLPSTAGYSSNPYVNLGGVDNKGWELTAQYNNNIGELNYSLGFNITHVKNKVVDMGGVAPIIDDYTRTEEGQSINSYYGYVVEGIYQSEEDIANSPTLDGAEPGDFKYKDLDDNGVIDDEDRKYLGNSIPEFYYGGNIDLEWRNFDMSVLLQGEFDKQIMVTPEYAMDFGRLYDYSNMYKEVYENRWTKEGDNTYYPAIGSGIRGINNVCNTRWLMDASYFRVKNLQIGYNLPKKKVFGVQLENLRVFLSATNLFTVTDYVGFDPEMGTRQKRNDSTGYIDKVYTRGGADSPQARTFEAGVNINF